MSELIECHGPWPNAMRPHRLLIENSTLSCKVRSVTPRSSLLLKTSPRHRPQAAPLEAASLNATSLGVVLDIYLLAPYVLLHHLGALYHLLADANLLLDHGPL